MTWQGTSGVLRRGEKMKCKQLRKQLKEFGYKPNITDKIIEFYTR